MSLPNTLTVYIDNENDGSPIPVIISEIERAADRSRYKFPTHSLIARDYVDFYRTLNKKTGNFNGVAKSAIKVTRDVSVPGVDTTTTLVAPQIAHVTFANPVGVTPAQELEVAMRLVGCIIDSVIRPKLFAMEV